MRIEKVTERILAKSCLTPEEMKVGRILYNLPTAGGENSLTRKWVEALGSKKRSELQNSVIVKVSILRNKTRKNRAGN